MKLALMIIDMQKEFYKGQTGERRWTAAAEYINYILPKFEEKGSAGHLRSGCR